MAGPRAVIGAVSTRRLAGDAATGGYRVRVRAAVNAFGTEALARWDDQGHIPRESLAELGRRGIFRMRWEPGAEEGLPYLIALSEEISALSSGLALAVMGHSEVFIGALRWLAEGAGQRALLDDALDGRIVGCFAATERQGGSSLAGIETTAVPAGDGWRLRGCKRYVSNVGGASHVLVLARPKEVRHEGDLGLFVVPLDAAGVRVDGFFASLGVTACDVGQVSFDARLPGDALLGTFGLGLLYASHLLAFERVSICAQLLSSAELALRLAAAYARQRVVGATRLMDKQVIRHRLAWCEAELCGLRAWLRDLTMRVQEQQRMPAREIAAFKLVAGERVERIVDACMQVFGARGCMRGFPTERLWRDCRMARLGGGTDEVLADLVASGLDRQDRAIEQRLRACLDADVPRPRSARPAPGQSDDVSVRSMS